MEWTITKASDHDYKRQTELTTLSDIEELEEYKEMLAEANEKTERWNSVIVCPSCKEICIYDDFVE